MKLSRIVAAGAVVITALAVSGCGELTVIDAGGTGNCEGKGDFTISTTQSPDASNYEISYDGPANVSIVMTQALFIDNLSALNQDPTIPTDFDGMAWTISTDNGTAVVERVDPSTDTGWTTSGSGAATHFEFSGTYEDLTSDALFVTDDQVPEIDSILPITVGVVCDDTISSGIFSVSDPSLQIIDTIQIQAADELDPRHILIDPLVIDSQEITGGGILGTAHFSQSTLDLFGSFAPDSSPQIGVVRDMPTIPNNTFGELWFQLLVQSGSSPLVLSLPDGVSTDGSFPFALQVNAGAETGNYLVLMLMADSTNNANDPRVVFMNLYYDSENGIAFLDPIGEPENPDLSANTELAATGFDVVPMGLAAAGALVVGAVVRIVRRRRV